MGSEDTREKSLQLLSQQLVSPHEKSQVQRRSAEHSGTKKDKVDKLERDGAGSGVRVKSFSWNLIFMTAHSVLTAPGSGAWHTVIACYQ